MKKNSSLKASFFAFGAAAILTGTAHSATSVPVSIKEGEKNFQGTLFVPEKSKGPLPLVMVVHEWWGKTEYPEMRARKIADELGYAALAVDLYGDSKTAATVQDAQALSGPFYKDPALGVKRIQAFIAAAPAAATQARATIDTSKIAAIGYCFGGAQVLNLARVDSMPANEKLLGVVSFHGSLDSTLKAKTPIESKILVLTGGADKMVDEKQVQAFKEEMKKDKADFTVISYPGALHAFTNPKATENGKKFGIPLAYDENADKDSWKRMTAFLKKLFRK